jgi:diacylglycerol kinase family enzyme
MEGYHLGTRESLNEGKLYLYLMRPQSRLGFVRVVLKLLLGRFRTSTDFEVFAADKVRVETSRASVDVSLDGEIVTLTSPLLFHSRPGELAVIAPAALEQDRKLEEDWKRDRS